MLAFHGFQAALPAKLGFTKDLLIKPLSQGGAYIGAATVQNNYNIEDIDAEAVQLVFGNYETTARTITKAAVALAWGLHTDGFTPLNSAGNPDNSLWQIVPGATNLVVGAAGAGGSPNYNRAYTPTAWMPVSTVGTGLRYLLVRVFGQITTYGLAGELQTSGVPGGAWGTIDQGRHLTSCYKFTADGVTNPGSWSGVTFVDIVHPAMIRIRSRKRGLSIAAGGDSITQGYRTISDHDSFIFKAAVLASTADVPVTAANFGVSGTTSSNFYQEACTVIASSVAPSLMCFPVYSPNDNTQAQVDMDAMWARAQDVVSRCQAAGIVPVLWGPTPYASTGVNNLPLRAQRDRAKTWCAANGVYFADMYAALEDPANPNQTLPSLNFGDGHPNDAGTTVMAQTLYSSVIQPLLAA